MRILLVAANILIPIAVLIFATGFFPYKPFIAGLASHDDFDHPSLRGRVPEAQFDKIIFMVVDALRSDFVFSSNSGFIHTQKLIRSGNAIPFTAQASSPTITMPKVKAMTTGSIPSFLDVILNFAESDTSSTLAAQDTWLAQIRSGRDRKGNGRLIMYGDDTWLKLFPDTFVRSDGTTSFFVSDFTEVDNNVTRHVPEELRNDDWDAMVLHYLGLDHIGHKAGPLSPNMQPKQREMDSIVATMYAAMDIHAHLNNTLLILCGDHGMTDGGNHGGSSSGETSPALVFISPKFGQNSTGLESPITADGNYNFYTKIDQSDLAATISSLLGHPIPKNNLGVMIPRFLSLWHDRGSQVDILLRNAQQILSIVKATFPAQDFNSAQHFRDCDDYESDADSLACKWKAAESLSIHEQTEKSMAPTIAALYSFLRHAQRAMSSTASNYDLGRLATGVLIMALAFFSGLIGSATIKPFINQNGVILSTIIGVYCVMMFASSYVEEEQQFWYWISIGWLAYLHAQSLQKSLTHSKQLLSSTRNGVLVIMTLHRIGRRWNQTGQKYAGSPDIVTAFLPQHPALLWALVVFTYCVSSLQVTFSVAKYLRLGYLVGLVSSMLLSVPSIALKLTFVASDAPELLQALSEAQIEMLRELPVVQIARFLFTILAALLLITVFSILKDSKDESTRKARLHTFFSLLILLLLTQIRTHNIPLCLFFIIQHKYLSSLRLSSLQITINTLLMAQASFFALGNSNAISSVDLSNGYNGVSDFNVIAVGLLVFISNWAGPIFWSLSGIVLLAGADQRQRARVGNSTSAPTTFADHVLVSTLFIAASTLAMMVACTILRTHLFIWTVFSPKYLYTMAWSLGYHYLVTIGLCGGLWRLTGHGSSN